MVRDPTIAVRDVIGEINFLLQLVSGKSLQDFERDSLAVRAAAYSIQIISEAVRHIPDDWLAEFPNESWQEIRSTGNKIRHEYFRLDEAILWRIIQLDCPSLKVTTETMLQRHRSP